jgi:hypothetical protein
MKRQLGIDGTTTHMQQPAKKAHPTGRLSAYWTFDSGIEGSLGSGSFRTYSNALRSIMESLICSSQGTRREARWQCAIIVGLLHRGTIGQSTSSNSNLLLGSFEEGSSTAAPHQASLPNLPVCRLHCVMVAGALKDKYKVERAMTQRLSKKLAVACVDLPSNTTTAVTEAWDKLLATLKATLCAVSLGDILNMLQDSVAHEAIYSLGLGQPDIYRFLASLESRHQQADESASNYVSRMSTLASGGLDMLSPVPPAISTSAPKRFRKDPLLLTLSSAPSPPQPQPPSTPPFEEVAQVAQVAPDNVQQGNVQEGESLQHSGTDDRLA